MSKKSYPCKKISTNDKEKLRENVPTNFYPICDIFSQIMNVLEKRLRKEGRSLQVRELLNKLIKGISV